MTQESDVAPGPLVYSWNHMAKDTFYPFLSLKYRILPALLHIFWEIGISEIGGAEAINKRYVVYTHHNIAFNVKNRKVKKSKEYIFEHK
jgi:hypothetical protein